MICGVSDRSTVAWLACSEPCNLSLAHTQELKNVQINTLLSMMATIFLPLTMLTALYGMNFSTSSGVHAIPLLQMGNGFGGFMAFWVFCMLFTIVLLLCFIQMGWFRLVGLSTCQATVFTSAMTMLLIALSLVSVALHICEQSMGHIHCGLDQPT